MCRFLENGVVGRAARPRSLDSTEKSANLDQIGNSTRRLLRQHPNNPYRPQGRVGSGRSDKSLADVALERGATKTSVCHRARNARDPDGSGSTLRFETRRQRRPVWRRDWDGFTWRPRPLAVSDPTQGKLSRRFQSVSQGSKAAPPSRRARWCRGAPKEPRRVPPIRGRFPEHAPAHVPTPRSHCSVLRMGRCRVRPARSRFRERGRSFGQVPRCCTDPSPEEQKQPHPLEVARTQAAVVAGSPVPVAAWAPRRPERALAPSPWPARKWERRRRA